MVLKIPQIQVFSITCLYDGWFDLKPQQMRGRPLKTIFAPILGWGHECSTCQVSLFKSRNLTVNHLNTLNIKQVRLILPIYQFGTLIKTRKGVRGGAGRPVVCDVEEHSQTKEGKSQLAAMILRLSSSAIC